MIRQIVTNPNQIPTDMPLAVLDLEMYDQELERLHRPHGHFAGLVITVGPKESYLVLDQSLLKASYARVDNVPRIIMHNANYDITQLWGLGIDIQPRDLWDTMIAEKCIHANLYDFFGLDHLVRRYYNAYLDKEVRDSFSNSEESIMTDEQIEYTFKDGEWTFAVYMAQIQAVEAMSQKMKALDYPIMFDPLYVIEQIDMPALWALKYMHPPKVNKQEWLELASFFEGEGQRLEGELDINVKSNPQVKAAVLDQLDIELENTQAATLEGLRADYPLVDKIMTARKYRDAASKYGTKWVERFVEEGDFVYTEWIPVGAKTGRTASRKPNLTNIPSHDGGIGMDKYRDMFIARGPDRALVVSDVSQQEPRIGAYLSQDVSLLEMFRLGQDSHQGVTDGVNEILRGMGIDEITRKDGKQLNLGIPYGKTEWGFSREFGGPPDLWRIFIDSFFAKFSGLHRLILRYQEIAYEKGFIATSAGRPFWINPYSKSWKNNSINSPIQGGASDHLKMAIIYVWKNWKSYGLPEYPLIMAVHDEIVADVLKIHVPLTVKLLRDAWTSSAEILFPGVPFEVDADVGATWAPEEVPEGHTSYSWWMEQHPDIKELQ